jgi:hypothetical protein
LQSFSMNWGSGLFVTPPLSTRRPYVALIVLIGSTSLMSCYTFWLLLAWACLVSDLSMCKCSWCYRSGKVRWESLPNWETFNTQSYFFFVVFESTSMPSSFCPAPPWVCPTHHIPFSL